MLLPMPQSGHTGDGWKYWLWIRQMWVELSGKTLGPVSPALTLCHTWQMPQQGNEKVLSSQSADEPDKGLRPLHCQRSLLLTLTQYPPS